MPVYLQWCPAIVTGISDVARDWRWKWEAPQWCPAIVTGISNLFVDDRAIGGEASMVSGHKDRKQVPVQQGQVHVVVASMVSGRGDRNQKGFNETHDTLNAPKVSGHEDRNQDRRRRRRDGAGQASMVSGH
jgi:hypothetical protein